MPTDIEFQLLEMVRNILYNINRPCEVQDLDMLLNQQFYFEVSPLIFPQFNIQIIKIAQQNSLSSVQKLQALLYLFQKKLELQLSEISPQQVLKGHFMHMFRLVRLLHSFSEGQIFDKNIMQVTKIQKHQSEPMLPHLQLEQDRAKSDIINLKLQQISNSISSKEILKEQEQVKDRLDQIQVKICQNIEEKKKYGAKKEAKKEKKIKKGTIQGMNPVEKQKYKPFRPSRKSINRHNQNQQIKLGNKKIKSYLQTYMKHNRTQIKRTTSQVRPKSTKINNTLYKDIQQIDNYFRSFEFQIRDQKQKYLRRMQQIIKNEQKQRLWANEKKTREEIKTQQKRKEISISRINQTHHVSRQLLKEELQNQRQQIILKKKQYEKKQREQIREHRQKNKKEIENIKNYIEQMNNKALMRLEEGGKFEKKILNMYKRY